MRHFRFMLQGVLEFRTALEEQSKQKLALTMEVLRRQRQCLEEFEAELVQNQRPHATGRLDVDRALLQADYLTVLETAVSKQAETVTGAVEDVARRQGEVVKAMQKRKVLENLRARRRADFDYLARRDEQKDLDEISTAAFARRQGHR